MTHYFYRHFRVVDCSHHCGLPVATACFILALITGAMQIYTLFFLYEASAYILMVYAAATVLVGLIAILTGFRIFTILYLLAESLCNIPVAVVIGYISFLLANWPTRCGCWYAVYTWWLYLQFGYGFLWSGEVVACISVPFSFLTLAGFRKLRLHQAGVNTAVQHGRRLHADECIVEAQHHHHVHPVVVQQPQVLTVQQPAVMTVPTGQPAVIMQTQPNLYPQLHAAPYGAAVVQQTQPTACLLEIPKVTITSFLIFAIVNKKNCVKVPNYVGMDFFVLNCPKARTSFELYLFNLDDFYLWSGLIVSVFSVIISAMAIYLIGKGVYTHFKIQRKRAFAFAHANIHELDEPPIPTVSLGDDIISADSSTKESTTKRPLFYSVSSTISI